MFKNLVKRIYLLIAVLVVGYYGYTAWYGKAFWETQSLTNTEHSGQRVHGIYRSYHK